MGRYRFLLKPLFFIFNLLFASWLVLKIEKISPSDLGRYESLFKNDPAQPVVVPLPLKQQLKELLSDHKAGKIDSATFEKQLDEILKTSQEVSSLKEKQNVKYTPSGSSAAPVLER